MKKNLILLAIATILVAFSFAIPIIDKLSTSRAYTYLSFYDDADHERIGIQIETEMSTSINTSDFYESMDSIARDNNLLVYILSSSVSKDNNEFENNIYISSNDIYLENCLLLERGYANDISSGKSYSTYSRDPDKKIVNFMYPTSTKVSPLTDYSEWGQYINLVNLKGDFKENTKKFMNSLSEIYGKLILKSPYTSSPLSIQDADKLATNAVWSGMNVKISVSIVLMIMLCLKFFSLKKRVSIAKIDGDSPFTIYFELFVKDFVTFMTLAFFIFSSLVFLIYGTNLITAKTIVSITGIQLVQIILFELLTSSTIYYTIYYTPIHTSMKGNNQLNEVQFIAYVCKGLTAFMVIPILTMTITTFKDFVTMVTRHDRVYDELTNYYSFGLGSASSKYLNDIGTENYISLRDHLAINGSLFNQSKSFFVEDYSKIDPTNLDSYYSVDTYFLNINKLHVTDCQPNEICVFLRKNTKYDVSNLDKKIRTLTREELPMNLHYYDKDIVTFSITEILYDNFIKDLPLVLIPPEEGLEGQLNDSIFRFVGSTEEAQKYLDTVFVQFGYTPVYKLNSLQATYSRFYQIYRNKSMNGFIQFIVTLVAFIFANRLLIGVDIDNNRNRYFISKFEGINPYSFVIYISKIVSPTLIALVFCVWFKSVSINVLLLKAILGLVAIEISFYGYYYFKYSNIRRFK